MCRGLDETLLLLARAPWSSPACAVTVATLAVEDPDTDEPDTEAVDDVDFASSTGEYAGKSSLGALAGDPMTLGGLRLSPMRRPVLSRPRSSSAPKDPRR